MLLEKLIIKKNNELNILKNKLLLRDERNKDELVNKIKYVIEDIDLIIEEYRSDRNKGFTKNELLKYDGVGDNVAYIAIDGTIYDVTGITGFEEGDFCGIKAGMDVTKEFNECSNKDKEKLRNTRVVGYLLE